MSHLRLRREECEEFYSQTIKRQLKANLEVHSEANMTALINHNTEMPRYNPHTQRRRKLAKAQLGDVGRSLKSNIWRSKQPLPVF